MKVTTANKTVIDKMMNVSPLQEYIEKRLWPAMRWIQFFCICLSISAIIVICMHAFNFQLIRSSSSVSHPKWRRAGYVFCPSWMGTDVRSFALCTQNRADFIVWITNLRAYQMHATWQTFFSFPLFLVAPCCYIFSPTSVVSTKGLMRQCSICANFE